MVKITKIILVRHGQTLWNDLGKYQGHTDVPLSKHGIEQAHQVAKRLKIEKINAIYSSDLVRAKQTAEIIALQHHLSVKTDSNFREINFGHWEGKTYKEVEKEYPDLIKIWISEPEKLLIPQGETFQQMLERVWKGLKKILNNHPQETVLLVAHGGVIGAIICDILSIKLNNLWRIRQDNTGISIIEFLDNKGILTLLNDTYHLKTS